MVDHPNPEGISMKLEIPYSHFNNSNSSFGTDQNHSFETNLNTDYLPFYAYHTGKGTMNNMQLVEEQIRILEERLQELRKKLHYLQDKS